MDKSKLARHCYGICLLPQRAEAGEEGVHESVEKGVFQRRPLAGNARHTARAPVLPLAACGRRRATFSRASRGVV
jgi:hypothetical protein